MIKEIRLKNFKQHVDQTFTFAPGLNTIQGENGRGKSNILKAILFALHGATAAGNKARLTTRGGAGMKVELDCVFADVGEVTIIRTLTRAEIRKGGEVLAAGQTDVTAWVEARLGMSAALFRSLLYAEQNKTQKLLDDGPSALQRQLETIAETKVIDQIITLINGDNNFSEGELEGLGDLEDINALRAEQHVTAELTVRLETKLRESEQGKEQLDQANKEAKAIYEKALQSRLDSIRFQSALARAEGELSSLRDQLGSLKQEEVESADPAATAEMEQEIRKEQDALQEMQRQQNHITSLHTERDKAMTIAKELDKWIPVLAEEERLMAAVKVTEDAVTLARGQLAARRAEVTATVCPTCKRPYELANLDAMKFELDAAQERFHAAEKTLEDANLAVQSLYTLHSTSAAKLRGFRATIQSVRERLAPAVPAPVTEEDRKALNEQWEYVNQRWQALAATKEKQQAYERWTAKVKAVEGSIASVEERIASIQLNIQSLRTASDEEIQRLKEVSEDATQAAAYAWEQSVLMSQELAKANLALAAIDTKVEAMEQKAARIQELRHLVAERTDLQKYLRNNRAKLMEDSWTALTQYASHLISVATEGLMTDLTRSEGGEFSLTESGHVTPVEELSGAQKSIVGLSLRLSLAHLFYGDQGFVLLDEVTADATEVTAANIAGMLRGLNSQVIMVTHRQSDALNANHSIFLP